MAEAQLLELGWMLAGDLGIQDTVVQALEHGKRLAPYAAGVSYLQKGHKRLASSQWERMQAHNAKRKKKKKKNQYVRRKRTYTRKR